MLSTQSLLLSLLFLLRHRRWSEDWERETKKEEGKKRKNRQQEMKKSETKNQIEKILSLLQRACLSLAKRRESKTRTTKRERKKEEKENRRQRIEEVLQGHLARR